MIIALSKVRSLLDQGRVGLYWRNWFFFVEARSTIPVALFFQQFGFNNSILSYLKKWFREAITGAKRFTFLMKEDLLPLAGDTLLLLGN